VPEYPDIVVYIEALEKRIQGQTIERISIASPFLLRTAVPPLAAVTGRKVVQLRRLGKRICIGLEDDLWLILHLMIAGRLHWREGKAGTSSDDKAGKHKAKTGAAKGRRGRNSLATFDFSSGVLELTEAGTQKRASLHLVEGNEGLQALNPGGEEIFQISLERFAAILRSGNHTLKRALTDPRLISGIGNAYSDEILFEARLSPVALTQKLSSSEIECLFDATTATITNWTQRLRSETGDGFPEGVTAFREGMAVHGRYKKPCPRCGNEIQRIRYASNETNYCPTCQTGGKLLADRSLSRLLRADWPRTAEELENLKLVGQ